VRRLVYSAAAKRSIEEITEFTRERWDHAQAERYVTAIKSAAETLRTMTDRGAPRPELGEGVRSISAGSHVLVYRTDDETVQVLLVIHHARDIKPVLGSANDIGGGVQPDEEPG
jgi:toxin ParE1/3/4